MEFPCDLSENFKFPSSKLYKFGLDVSRGVSRNLEWMGRTVLNTFRMHVSVLATNRAIHRNGFLVEVGNFTTLTFGV